MGDQQKRILVLGMVLLGGGCLSTEIPPPPGAGSIQATLVYAQPGRADTLPAASATIELLGTSLVTTSNESGYFQLSPVPVRSGQLSIRFDADGDGLPERSRLLSLESIGAGPGKTTALGNVLLGGNATLQGTVLRTDLLGAASGHGGTNVFVPQGPYLVFTGDNGGFTLPSLPEGDITIAVFREGYQAQQFTVSLAPQQTASLPTVLLAPLAGESPRGALSGVATLLGLPSSEGITVTVAGRVVRSAQTDPNGQYTLADLPHGLYTLAFEREGFQTVTLRNIVVAMANVQAPSVVLTPGVSRPPDLDAGPRYDGGLVDAGVVDAGVTDAGAMDAGGTDAGAMDAGAMDGGSMDGGSMDGGMDAGSVDAGLQDAGVDGGPPPVAILGALPAFVAPGSALTLSGQASTGTRPFVYRWTAPVPVPNNNTSAAATPLIVAPSTPTVMTLGLEVVDAVGRVSPQVTGRLPVGTRPTATIASGTPTTAFARQTVAFDGASSSDPGGTGIAQYTWGVTPAGLQVMTANGGAQLLVTMPALVTVAQVVEVSLTVTNGVGITSAPVVRMLTLSSAPAPTWTIDAGPGQTVNSNTVVTLVGSASAPGFGPGIFSYTWTPVSSLDGGAGLDWVLTDPNVRTPSFVSPAVVGPNRLIPFVLTVTNDAGLMPESQQSVTFVNVLDSIPPSVVSTEFTALRMGNLGFSVEFSEPISSVNSVSASPANVVARTLDATGTRLTVALGATQLLDGTSVTINLGGVRDVSPQDNQMPGQTINSIARLLWSPPFVSDAGSTVDPKPGLVLRELKDGGLEALIFGRKTDRAWFLQPFNPSACSVGPCILVDEVGAPTPLLTPAPPRGARGLRWQGNAMATLQQRDARSATGVTFARFDGGWVPFPEPPGPVFSDEVSLFSTWPEGGLRVARFDATAFAWSLADAGVVTTDQTAFPFDGGTLWDPIPIGTARIGNASFIAARTSASGELRAFGQTGPGGSWTPFGGLGTIATPDKVVETRSTTTSNYPTVGYTSFLRQSGAIELVIYGSPNNSFTVVPSGATAFDTAYRGNQWFGAVAIGGQLRLRTLPFGTGIILTFTGPQPGDALNANPACVADSPELAFVREKVGVVWSEKCGAEPWHIVFRLLN